GSAHISRLRDQHVQRFGYRFGGGIPVVSVGSGTDRELHAAIPLPDILRNPLGRIPSAEGNRPDRLPGMRPPQIAAYVIAGAVGVDPFLYTQVFRAWQQIISFLRGGVPI